MRDKERGKKKERERKREKGGGWLKKSRQAICFTKWKGKALEKGYS